MDHLDEVEKQNRKSKAILKAIFLIVFGIIIGLVNFYISTDYSSIKPEWMTYVENSC